MDLNIIGTCDFTEVNKEIQNVSKEIEGLERDLGELNFDEVKDKLTSSLRVNPKMLGIEELKNGYLSLEQNIGTLDTVSAKYSATVSAYQTLVEDIRVKQRALDDEFVRAAAVQDDKTMIACRQALTSLKTEYEWATAKLQAYQTQMAEVNKLAYQASEKFKAFAELRNVTPFDTKSMSDAGTTLENTSERVEQAKKEWQSLRMELSSLKEALAETPKDKVAMLESINAQIQETQSKIDALKKEVPEAFAFTHSDVKFEVSAGAAKTASGGGGTPPPNNPPIPPLDDFKKFVAEYKQLALQYNEDQKLIFGRIEKPSNLEPTKQIAENSETLKELDDLDKQLSKALDKLAQAEQAAVARMRAALDNGDRATAEAAAKSVKSLEAAREKITQETKKVQTAREKLQKENATLSQQSVTTPTSANDEKKGGFFANLKDTLKGSVGNMKKDLTDLGVALSKTKSGFNQMGKGGIEGQKGMIAFKEGLGGVRKAMLNLLKNPWVLLFTAIAAVIIEIGKSIQKFFTQTQEGTEGIAKIKGTIEGVIAFVQALFDRWGAAIGRFALELPKLWNLITTSVTDWWNNMTTKFTNIGTWIGNFTSAMGTWFSGLWSAIKGFFKGQGWDSSAMDGAFDHLQDGLQDTENAYDATKKAAEEYKKAMEGIGDAMQKISLEEYVKTYQEIENMRAQLKKEKAAEEKNAALRGAKKASLGTDLYGAGLVEQKAAAEAMQQIAAEEFAAKESIAKKELAIIQKENALKRKSGILTLEDTKKQRDAEIELINLQTRKDSELRSIARRYKSITDQLYEQQKQQEKTLREQQEQREIAALQQRINLETDINEKLKLQAELREKNLKKQLALLEEEKKSAIRKNYGDNGLKEYEEKGTLENDSAGILDFYTKKEKGVRDAAAQKERDDEFKAELDRLQKFYDDMEQIEADHAAKMKEFQENGASAQQEAQEKEVYEKRKAQAAEQLGVGDDKAFQERFVGFAQNIAGKAFEEIQVIYKGFLDQLEKDIATEDAKVKALQKYETEDDMGKRVSDINTQLESGLNAEGKELTPQEEIDLQNEKVLLEQMLVEIMAKEGGKAAYLTQSEKNLTTLKKGKVKAEQTYVDTIQKAETKEKRTNQKLNKDLSLVTENLKQVKDALNAVADTFGGALSKNSKKAIGAMTDIAEFGIQSVNSISALANGTMKGMSMTAFMASESISTVEKASVILTIISLAVQAIMAIVNIAKRFTKAAQIQDAIDEQLEKVEELKRKNEELQRAYKSEIGVDYYKGMAKAANDYNNIIREQQEALRQAQELQKLQENKYGEDSGKAKDAKDQTNEIQDALHDLEDEQAELFQQLRDELLGTDLHSFSENLADSLIEGFENGKEGIADTWDDMLNDLLTSMMKKQLAMELEKQFQGVFDKMNDMVDNDGVLSQDEISDIVDLMNGASAGAQQIAEAYYDLMDEMGILTDSDEAGSKGGFESMSQDTADELNARFTALQITGANMDATMQTMSQAVIELGVSDKLKMTILQTLQENIIMGVQTAQNQLDQLRIIADNTGMLTETNRQLKAIEQHTAKL